MNPCSPSSTESQPIQARQSDGSTQTCIRLRVQGLGHVPAFKNNKVLFLTNPKRRDWMDQCQAAFESQLLYSYPTTDGETVTAQSLRCWIASVLPEDDCRQCLTGCSWNCFEVPKKQEGALITIERA